MSKNWDLTQPQHKVNYYDTVDHQIDQAKQRVSTYEAEKIVVTWPRKPNANNNIPPWP